MCIICLKPEGSVLPSFEILENCFFNNPDGAGYAVKRKGLKNVYFKKGFFNFNELYNALMEENISDEDICAIHFRIATNGSVTSKNCHPFFITEDRKSAFAIEGSCKSVLFHNGVLSKKYSYDKNVSDTFLFTQNLAKKEKSLIAKKRLVSFIEKETTGSRILYFSAEGVIKSGDWIFDAGSGCFFSNYSFEPAFYSVKSYDFEFPSPTWYFETTLKCPECGEDFHYEKISETHDLHECRTCGALFNSRGEFLEVFNPGHHFNWKD